MSHQHARRLLAATLLVSAVTLGSASAPVFWQVATRAEFLKGDAENLSIDNDGRVSLGPATATLADASAPFVWALERGADGALYAGTGNEGKVLRIDQAGQSRVFFDAPELEVHALAAAPGGGLYVATSPDGRIYKVDAKGQATSFFDPDDKYIWSLAVAPNGTVYAGTGDKGVVYRISPDGTGSVFYRTRSANVVSLAIEAAGSLLAGTESPGRVIRVDADGKGFVLLDSAFREIHALRLDGNGAIYASAVGGTKEAERSSAAMDLSLPDTGRSAPVPGVSTEITSISVIDVGAATATETKPPARTGTRASKGAVYRIAPDGVWDAIWESNDDTPYDVSVDRDGAVTIGTGGKGKIFRVSENPPRITLVSRAPAQQVTRFLAGPKGELVYATANPGKVLALSPGLALDGTYTSDVRDAQTVATWGTISWRASVPAGATVELRSRSGNSETPDETWSPWSAPYRNADGEPVQSPKARYLQWQAKLTGKTAAPVLTSVTMAYLQRNLRPRVTGITVYPPGIVFQKPFSTGEAEIAGFEDGWPDTRPSPATLASSISQAATAAAGPALGRRTYQKGLQAFTWKAEDENEDKLHYDVLYRREGDTAWKTLRRAISEQLFVWDTSSVPNGTYVLRIVASDAPSNPPGLALGSEADSVAFDVDNTPPEIRILSTRRDGTRTVIRFEARDDQSAVQRVDYSLEANRWRPIYPADGICDSRLETFELVVEGPATNVVIRAMDTLTNVATTRGDSAVSR